MHYLDTSAAIKLLFEEPESSAIRRWVQERTGKAASSDLLRTELLRATMRINADKLDDAQIILHDLFIVRLGTNIYRRAGELAPVEMRSLDAIHLAAALELGDELEGIITYDDRMAEGARSLGIEVFTPM